MTLQVERNHHVPGTDRTPLDRRSRRQTVAIVAALVATMGGATLAGVTSSGRGPASTRHSVVLGSAREPLPVHQVISRGSVAAAADGQRLVPVMGQPGRKVLVRDRPAVNLHVRYAHVRPVMGHWQLEMVAAEGSTFTMDAAHGRSYEVLVNGRGLMLFFVGGSPYGATFGIGGGASLTEAEAVAIARSLTTQVTVAACTPAEIADNMCA